MGRDIGDLPLLRADYEAPRLRANLAMAAALEGLQRVFCGPGGGPLGAAASAARAAGLGAVGAAGPVRRGVMRYAMGLPLGTP